MKTRVLFGSVGWPCGIHEIASQVVRLGLAEAEIQRLDDEAPDGLGKAFLSRFSEFQPQIVGLRIEGGQFDLICRQIKRLRQAKADLTMILGGPTATLHPVEVLEQTGADFVFSGDAERPFASFLKAYDHCNFLHEIGLEIPGLSWRAHGEIVSNPPQEVDEATLRENRLDWSLLKGFDNDLLTPLDSIFLTGGRGCPGRCSFCAKLHGQQIRTKSAMQIIEEILGADRLVRDGKLRLTVWPLYAATDQPALKPLSVSWCSVFDEDFFLDRRRAVQFLQLFEFHGFQRRYRLGFQTNPRSLLEPDGRPDAELFYWISRLKAMIQLGAESFHPELLRRWNKRHSVEQLETALDALDETGQDYNVFHVLADYDSTVDEVLTGARRLLDAAMRHPRMRIASTSLMIPLYGTEIQRNLQRSGRFESKRLTDYETPQPQLLPDNLVELIDRIDLALQDALHPQRRESALKSVSEILAEFE